MKIDPFDLHLLYKGVFDYDELYKKVNDWMLFRGYQLHETIYEAKGKEYGKELRVDWEAWRKINEAVKLILKVHYQIWDIQYINVEQNGKSKKLMKARMYIRFTRQTEFDFSDSFGKTSFKMQLRKFLYLRVFKEFFDSLWEDKLRFKMYQLQSEVKEVLDMQTVGNEHWDVW